MKSAILIHQEKQAKSGTKLRLIFAFGKRSHLLRYFGILMLILIASACETTYTPELENAAGIVVVDAWITMKPETQVIRITRSQPYFENSFPEKVSGAIVQIVDLNDGTLYEFSEGEEAYFWEPDSDTFGIVGHQYRLTVVIEGETFEATARLGRVPAIDSIRFEYNPEDVFISQEYYTAEFVATDPEGTGDTYWIKAWKNDTYLGKPSELNMVYDAAFSAGQGLDGQAFLLPIRKDFLNPLDKEPGKDNKFLPPYLAGDSVYVEIHSIDPHAYDFLWGVYYYTVRPGGFTELFSVPLANASTNLASTDPNSSTDIAGFFNVAAVSSMGKKLTPELASKVKQIALNR